MFLTECTENRYMLLNMTAQFFQVDIVHEWLTLYPLHNCYLLVAVVEFWGWEKTLGSH